MQLSLALFALVGAAIAAPQPQAPATRCNADNCARALTGTAFGTPRAVTRVADCAQFQTTTLVPAVTTTSTVMGTVPAFASACKNSAAFASACSCAGVPAATVTSLPAQFLIKAKDESGGTAFVGVGADTQELGNTGGPVLTQVGTAGSTTAGIFRLGTNGVLISVTDGNYQYHYPGSASKFYGGSSTAAPSFNGQTYLPSSCSLGAFEASVAGYLLTCTNPTGSGTRGIRQQQGNYGIAYPGFDEGAPQGPDVTVTFYAVQA